ncbi:MAG TPA: SDR family oxidoreductase, partial [Nevskia sp.]|nr:SDR family oxidoreductase [Nevskia sp.]
MQRVLVTGANRGLGLEFAQQLLARGARVIAACRQPGRALKLTELAAAHPGHLHVLPLDLARERSIAGLAHEAGMLTDRLDALINNAGVLVSGERYGELAAKAFAETFATNVIGPLLLTQALTSLLEHGDAARVVNLSSDLGSHADTLAFNTPSYAISKAALNMVTRLTAAELGPRGITVISLNPGWVRTDMGGARAPLAANESVAAMLE